MKILKKIAAVLALFIGAISVIVGSKVLLGAEAKDYHVMIGLVTYNVIFGLISITTAYFLWENNKLGKMMMSLVLAAHLITLIYITNFIDNTATESKMAMLFRVSIWIIISVLYFVIPKVFQKINPLN